MRSGVSAPLGLDRHRIRHPGFSAPPGGQSCRHWALVRRRLRAREPGNLERRRSELQPRHRQPGDQRHGLCRCRVLGSGHTVFRTIQCCGSRSRRHLGLLLCNGPRRRQPAETCRGLVWLGIALFGSSRLPDAPADMAAADRTRRRLRRHDPENSGRLYRRLSNRAFRGSGRRAVSGARAFFSLPMARD